MLIIKNITKTHIYLLLLMFIYLYILFVNALIYTKFKQHFKSLTNEGNQKKTRRYL